MMRAAVQEMLSSALQQGIGSGFAASFGKIDQISDGKSPNEIYLGKTGHIPQARAVDAETFFDLASLTKILATTLLAMIRVEKGSLDLDRPGDWGLTPRDLLTHASGLPAWRPFYEGMRAEFGAELSRADIGTRQRRFDSLVDSFVSGLPSPLPERGKILYSDIGFLLLERILSSALDQDLSSVYSAKRGLQLHYRPSGCESLPALEQVMMTEQCPWRGLLQGAVHDDNAWSRGGIAGHAGLFGRLRDVQHWVEALFSELWVSRRTLRAFSKIDQDPSGSRRALGFDVPALGGVGSTGYSFSPNSIGHLGFTGTSLWLDLDSGDYAILLSNRVHPSRGDDRIRRVRREFHEIIRGGA
jgi:CubicO group peptidase (beta-lactamase class C family)